MGAVELRMCGVRLRWEPMCVLRTLIGMETYGDRDDGQLWRAASADPQAFGELFERHARAVFAFCARRTGDLALAEDLTSVVFLEAWRRRSVHRGHEHAAVAVGNGE